MPTAFEASAEKNIKAPLGSVSSLRLNIKISFEPATDAEATKSTVIKEVQRVHRRFRTASSAELISVINRSLLGRGDNPGQPAACCLSLEPAAVGS